MHREGLISTKQLEYLSGPPDPRPRRFYILPKIHKNADSWTVPSKMPPGRPIISNINSENDRVSEYVESFLQPLACKHKSYIKNSYGFIEKIKNLKISRDTYIVTGDITNLYTNMHHDYTIASRQNIFNKYAQNNRPDKHLIDIIKLILENNDFEFNGETFLQCLGCSMGTRVGPSCANIYLLEFDEAAMQGFHIKPIIFFRYLDDVFFLWSGSIEELKEYENYLNSITPGIKLLYKLIN